MHLSKSFSGLLLAVCALGIALLPPAYAGDPQPQVKAAASLSWQDLGMDGLQLTLVNGPAGTEYVFLRNGTVTVKGGIRLRWKVDGDTLTISADTAVEKSGTRYQLKEVKGDEIRAISYLASGEDGSRLNTFKVKRGKRI